MKFAAVGFVIHIKTIMDYKIYTYNDVYESALRYFDGDPDAVSYWMSRIALKDQLGNLCELSPQDTIHRFALEIARIECKYENAMDVVDVEDLLKDFKYVVPHTSLLSSVGDKYHISPLSSSFAIGTVSPYDSYGAIFKTDEEQVQLMKRRANVSHDISHIRPQGFPVKGSSLTSSGIIPFTRRFILSMNEVKQRNVKNSLMLSLSLSHPDIALLLDFISDNDVSGCNFIVKVEDDFIKAIQTHSPYELKYPMTGERNKFTKTVDACTLWNWLMTSSIKYGQPGIAFSSNVLKESLSDCYGDKFRSIVVDPNSEIVLSPYEGLKGLSLNLFSYVRNPFTSNAEIDFELLSGHAEKAMRILDDIVDMEIERIELILTKISMDPEDNETKRTETMLWEKIRKACVDGRRVCLSFIGMTDMFVALNINKTQDLLRITEDVARTIMSAAYKSSIKLAEERGAFPLYDSEKEYKNPFIIRLAKIAPDVYKAMKEKGRRNIACLAHLSTDDGSVLSGVSGGFGTFSQLYSVEKNDVNMENIDGYESGSEEGGYIGKIKIKRSLKRWLDVIGKDVSEIKTPDDVYSLIDRSPFKGMEWENFDNQLRIELFSVLKRNVDQSMCFKLENNQRQSTNNLIDLQGGFALNAWSRGANIVTFVDDSKAIADVTPDNKRSVDLGRTIERPISLECDVVRFQNNKEKWIAFVGLLDGKPYEIFTGLNDEEDGIMLPKSVTHGFIIKSHDIHGNSRYDFQFVNKRGFKTTVEGLSQKFNHEYWNYAKLISGVLRYGMPIELVIKLVSGLQLNNESINTWKIGVARALRKYVIGEDSPIDQICPSCGNSTLKMHNGIIECEMCGYTRKNVE